MNHSLEDDQRLLSRCVSGDRRASEILVRRFSDLVYRSVRRTLIIKQVPFSQQDLEDLHNTVFLQLFDKGCKKLRQYEGRNGCSLASWIRLVAVRIMLNHLRKKGIDAIYWQKKRIPLEDLSELKGEEMEAWAAMEKAEQGRLLESGIQKLPTRDRLFLKLHFEKELSMEEVAKAMQVSVQNAYIVKHRAIQRLKLHVTSVMNDQL
jgi:RNA polymerase sigma factor (sigma-70 family)